MITGIIILHGILSRRMEMSGRIIQPHIIYSYSAVLYFFGFMGLWYQVLRARCQQYYIKGVLQTHRHLNLVFSDFMCRCVVCRSASVPLLCNILALAQETVRHKHRITANYPIFGNLWYGHVNILLTLRYTVWYDIYQNGGFGNDSWNCMEWGLIWL